jgi:Putative beta barrel porin-7 (BBP7)
VKTALTFVLVALGGIGLSVDSRATAQQQAPPSNPAYATVQPPASGGSQQGVVNGAPQPAGTAGPNAPANPAADTGLLVDNGLWDGAPVGPCCAICGGGSGPPPDWYMEQDVMILNRSRPRDAGIGFEFVSPNGNSIGDEVLNSRTATPNISGVWGMMFGHYFARDTQNRDHFIEFSFWGGNNWQDQASYSGHRTSVFDSQGNKILENGDLFSGYAVTQVLNTTTNANVFVLNGILVPGFDKADVQTTYYSSSTANFEVNGRISPRGSEDRLVLHPNGKWRRECQPGLYMSYLYGLRFLQINETFRFHSEGRTDVFSGGQLIDSRENTGDYDIVTHNSLLGPQIGADMIFRQCRWTWGVRSKLGACVNFCDQVSDISSGPALAPTDVRRLSWSKHQAAVVGEVGFEATYKFRPNLVGRAAYDFMWVSGVALAPEQLQFNTEPSDKINANGLALFNGLKLGLEWLW